MRLFTTNSTGWSIPEFNSITEPMPSLTISSRIISVSPKRIDTGSCTSIRSARLDTSSPSGLFEGVSIDVLLPPRPNVARYDEGLVRRVHPSLCIQFALAGDLQEHR